MPDSPCEACEQWEQSAVFPRRPLIYLFIYFDILVQRYLLPTCRWMIGLWATDVCLKRHPLWAISKLTDSLFERWHEDKWAQADCGEWCIIDIIPALDDQPSRPLLSGNSSELPRCRWWVFGGSCIFCFLVLGTSWWAFFSPFSSPVSTLSKASQSGLTSAQPHCSVMCIRPDDCVSWLSLKHRGHQTGADTDEGDSPRMTGRGDGEVCVHVRICVPDAIKELGWIFLISVLSYWCLQSFLTRLNRHHFEWNKHTRWRRNRVFLDQIQRL